MTLLTPNTSAEVILKFLLIPVKSARIKNSSLQLSPGEHDHGVIPAGSPGQPRQIQRARTQARIVSEVLMAFPRPLRVLVALSVLACTDCLGRPAPELASFPVRSELDCRIHDFETLEIMDVAIVIDASSSTRSPAGADIDDNGVIGVFTQSVMTDYGDTRLTAQVAAVRSLVRRAPGSRSSASLDV